MSQNEIFPAPEGTAEPRENLFTFHNIQFADGSRTMTHGKLLSDRSWCKSALRAIKLIYRGAPQGKSVIDLGSLEGGYAVEFARMGMDALGIEIRQSNFENCLKVKEKAALPNLNLVKDDIWNLPKYGMFDVIFCCGLLYHLDRPREFIRLMGEHARDAIILNTHFASWESSGEFYLSQIEESGGLPGRWFFEHDLEPGDELDQLKWAAWNNKQSFWLTKEALCEALHEAGFDMIFEQYDMVGKNILETLVSDEWKRFLRTMIVGVRTQRL